MRRIEMEARRYALVGLAAAMVFIGPGVFAAHATASPVGACCLAGGDCQSVTAFDCDALGGDFIGVDTSCVMIDCANLRLTAPLLSIFGVVVGVGALLGLGVSRLVVRGRA